MESSRNLQIILTAQDQAPAELADCFAALGIETGSQLDVSRLPFSAKDITAGSETELQAVVIGQYDKVDLPRTIRDSRYFSNLQRRTRSGESPQRMLYELDAFLHNTEQQVWENSWVRFARRHLSSYAEKVFRGDLLADKTNPGKGHRGHPERFHLTRPKGEPWLRVPVSYLLKLALADLLGNQLQSRSPLHQVGESLLGHYLNDNSSPETFSFHVARLKPERGMGRDLASETAKRYLFSQLLIRYANLKFGLLESGQEARVYFAPHPPLRQRQLNELIPDNFYRHLFMSPCLSGWDQGQAKHRYMELCHQVLSRSQLNAVAKLREAGIITNNLVVLPNLSNTSLANNGVHISLGSKQLSAACQAGEGFDSRHEKYLGDLASKILEHFLPLFVNSYSAAPYRLDFADFHPERALGFLPHELDFTHLRMLWRRWKKKASLSCFGHALTPFGPPWLDRRLSRFFGLRGDLVPDFRLIDYPIAFLSSEQSPAYNGRLGNQELLKSDLADMGVFDPQMSLYQFFKLRETQQIGFSGLEGRHYSLFPDLELDLTAAANLQVLITALAYKYMASGEIDHRHIPDSPVIESERRQIFFARAIGVPTVYIRRNTRNQLLQKILKQTDKVRASRRYPGYLRIFQQEYCRALLQLLRVDAAELIEMFGFSELLSDLEEKLLQPQSSAAARLTGAISKKGRIHPHKCAAEDFNRAAENYYREDLRRQHMEQALRILQRELQQLEIGAQPIDRELRPQLEEIMAGRNPLAFMLALKNDLLNDQLGIQPLVRLLNLLLLCEQRDRMLHQEEKEEINASHPSIHRAL